MLICWPSLLQEYFQRIASLRYYDIFSLEMSCLQIAKVSIGILLLNFSNLTKLLRLYIILIQKLETWIDISDSELTVSCYKFLFNLCCINLGWSVFESIMVFSSRSKLEIFKISSTLLFCTFHLKVDIYLSTTFNIQNETNGESSLKYVGKFLKFPILMNSVVIVIFI